MIVKKFNGSINFISEYNKGSTFFFTFELESRGIDEIVSENFISRKDNTYAIEQDAA